MEGNLPITERPSELTTNIDISSPEEIFNMLYQCDLQIFNGWLDYPGLTETQLTAKLLAVSDLARKTLEDPKGCIVLGGCGTSGRLAFLTARNFQELIREETGSPCIQKYEYFIAGHDVALFTSQEAPEDDYNLGKDLLAKFSAGGKKVLYFGITCGLSAAFVAGQLDYCLEHTDSCIPVLLGFNPVHMARTEIMKGTSKCFRDVATQVHEHGYILNPVLGPEPITGSSRMKGGSATKILLDTILLLAHYRHTTGNPNMPLSQVINLYKMTHSLTYSTSSISKYIPIAAQSLLRKGHIFYLGWGTEGIFTLIDAAECMPTFGACFEDVRAFIDGGFDTLKNKEGDLSIDIAIEYFVSTILPSLQKCDTIFLVNPPALGEGVQEIMKMLKDSDATVVCISVMVDSEEHGVSAIPTVQVDLAVLQNGIKSIIPDSKSMQKFLVQSMKEIACKWLLNYVSTAAYVVSGKVFNNVMVDLKLANEKLFHRGIGIVSSLTKVSPERAFDCILKAMSIILDAASDGAEQKLGISHLVEKASGIDKIMPKAILLAANEAFNLCDAEAALQECPVIRSCMQKYLNCSKKADKASK